MPRQAARQGPAVDTTSDAAPPEASSEASGEASGEVGRVTPVSHAYSGAGDHYTSPTRRDWVKREWEEPAFRRHLDAALRRARDLGLRDELDVLDVGCGTGVAIELLLEVPALAQEHLSLRRSTGLDLDAALLEIASRRFADDPRIRFVTGDMGEAPDTGPHDLVLSSGVPFSHLEPAELERSLTRLAAISVAPGRDDARTSLLVIDVLGRHSLEWTSRWDTVRWDYRMSFFATDVDVSATPMTTWDGPALSRLIARAADAAGTRLLDLQLVDRSLAVGRHTMTGEYTPGLPRLRDLVDGLADPQASIDPSALRIDLTLPDAPEPVLEHHAAFTAAWNAALDGPLTGPDLAEHLRDVEAGFEDSGLGVGHSLTAYAVLAPA